MILILLGGIGKYNKEWIKSLEGKIQLNPFEQGGMTQTFESLFFWLILINVLIIIIISMLLYNKFRITEEASRGATNISKDTKLDLTTRSRLAGERPGMKSSQPKMKRPEEEVKREREEKKSNKITLTGELSNAAKSAAKSAAGKFVASNYKNVNEGAKNMYQKMRGASPIVPPPVVPPPVE